MKNFKHYSDNTFDFHTKVLNQKKSQQYKNYIKNLDGKTQQRFQLYDDLFKKKELESITISPYNDIEKNELKKLYVYQDKCIQDLKKKLTTTEKNRIINTCPNCTISEISSFDHYLPKEEFPEFVVNPKNLFPSCSICNSYKGSNWKIDKNRLFLNLYLDDLPNVQYLFVNLQFNNDLITAQFYLKNSLYIEPHFYDLIESHYSRLQLCSRFELSSSETISSLDNTIRNSIENRIPINTIKKIAIEKSNQDRDAYGFNYWKSILEITLLNNNQFLSRY